MASLGSSLSRGFGSWLGGLFISVIFVAELRDAVTCADRQIHALAAPVPERELAVEVFGIGWIFVAEAVPAFPNPVQIAVMQIEERVTADRGEVGHIAPEGDVSEEMRVLVHPGVEPKAAGRRVDVQLLVEAVQTEPIPPECIDPFAPIDPRPAGAVIERGARVSEHGGEDKIGGVSGDRVPVGKRKILIVQHLANDPFELREHESMPRQEVPLLILLRVRGVVGVGLTAVPHGLGEGLLIRRE